MLDQSHGPFLCRYYPPSKRPQVGIGCRWMSRLSNRHRGGWSPTNPGGIMRSATHVLLVYGNKSQTALRTCSGLQSNESPLVNRTMLCSFIIWSSLALTRCLAQSYTVIDSYNGPNFFSKFNFFTGGDPTDGWVDYVDYDTAVATHLIPQTNVANWGVDIVNTLDPGSPSGRPSVRISSKATYNHGLFIADVQHMPDSTCGLWVSHCSLL